MQPLAEQKPVAFVDRRQSAGPRPDGPERRQFTNSHSSERPDVVEMAEAIDRYKLLHRRRFITYDELYDVIAGLGYRKG
ncbi:MAG TPA: hypothetical protein VML55_14745 [Planctomycetaceae bacterium]|nr:hypothetical protein [Planctomycetaceae bacterium]